ncbi:hypothetical protein [Rahnella variigena]|nr:MULTISPECIES: hypothetical protein [Rahnella]
MADRSRRAAYNQYVRRVAVVNPPVKIAHAQKSLRRRQQNDNAT